MTLENDLKLDDICIHQKYTAKQIGVIEKKNCWNRIEIGVFRGEEQIGSYVRGYPSFFETFFPFIGVDGKEYALFSADYTKTEVMSLPDCKKVCETSDSFCPTGFYVPILEGVKLSPDDPEPDQKDLWKEWLHRNWVEKYASFGFVSGCVWGDDTSDKVEFLDLSRIPEGIVTKTQRFDYFELPNGICLKDAVTVDCVDNIDKVRIEIATKQTFKL